MPTETELKLKLSSEKNYLHLCSFLGNPISEKPQKNIYLDTVDFQLRQNKDVLRVRQEGAINLLTFKSKATQIEGVQMAQELEQEIGEWNLTTIGAYLYELNPEMDFRNTAFHIVGCIENLRKTYEFQGLRWEVDRTQIGSKEYFELEIESAEIEKCKPQIFQIFEKLNIPIVYEISKFARMIGNK